MASAEGDVFLEDKVLIIKRIRVLYTLTGCPDDKRDAAQRAHSFHASKCPVARSVANSIDISTELTFGGGKASAGSRRGRQDADGISVIVANTASDGRSVDIELGVEGALTVHRLRAHDIQSARISGSRLDLGGLEVVAVEVSTRSKGSSDR